MFRWYDGFEKFKRRTDYFNISDEGVLDRTKNCPVYFKVTPALLGNPVLIEFENELLESNGLHEIKFEMIY